MRIWSVVASLFHLQRRSPPSKLCSSQFLIKCVTTSHVGRLQAVKSTTRLMRTGYWLTDSSAPLLKRDFRDVAHAISVPVLGSLIASMTLDSKEVGLTDFPRSEHPPIVIPFFAFRVMVGCGLLMLLVAWGGTLLSLKERLLQRRALLWTVFLCFPLPFIATLTGWFTAEVGRQPWTVYGLLRTADALTPFLTPRAAAGSLLVFCATYVFIFTFGTFYIYRLLKGGPAEDLLHTPPVASPNRPLSVAADLPSTAK